MNKRIYLIIIYIITALCIIAGILGNIFNAAPFNRLTASSSGNNCDFYEELKAFSNITIDGTVASNMRAESVLKLLLLLTAVLLM